MDGILADFVAGVCEAHKKPDPYLEPQNKGNYNIELIWKMNCEQFFAPCDEDFWANLAPMYDAEHIVQTCIDSVGVENVCLLSSPSKNKGCVEGKLRWIIKHFPQFKRRFLFGPKKDFCAAPNRILVDDYKYNIIQFINAGGRTHHHARPWNDSTDSDLKGTLDYHLGEIHGRKA